MTQLWRSTSTNQNEMDWFPFRYDNCTVSSFEIKDAGNDINITLKNVPMLSEYTYILYRPGASKDVKPIQGVARVIDGDAKLSLPKMEDYVDGMEYHSASFIYRLVSTGYVSQVYRKNILDESLESVYYHTF